MKEEATTSIKHERTYKIKYTWRISTKSNRLLEYGIIESPTLLLKASGKIMEPVGKAIKSFKASEVREQRASGPKIVLQSWQFTSWTYWHDYLIRTKQEPWSRTRQVLKDSHWDGHTCRTSSVSFSSFGHLCCSSTVLGNSPFWLYGLC